MIHTNRIVTVGEQESIIDRPIVLYRGDREVEIEFTLVGNEFTFSEEGNVIKSVNASHGQLVLNTPSGEHMFSELAECHEGKVVFVVTKEMIDEFIEMGFYSFQIRLYDSAEMKSRVTIPPVMNGFDIRNPIAAEDETNVVDQGIVDYARIFKDQSNEELPTFTWDGEYVKTEWAHHDVITENKLNKIEDALYSINANIKESDVVMLNALDNVKKDADKYVKEHMAEVESDVEEFERNLNTDVQKFKIDTNAAMTAHKNEVSEELESVNSQLADIVIDNEKELKGKINILKFGVKGNANYIKDGVAYEDENFTILADDETELFQQAINYCYDNELILDLGTSNILVSGNIRIKNIQIIGRNTQRKNYSKFEKSLSSIHCSGEVLFTPDDSNIARVVLKNVFLNSLNKNTIAFNNMSLHGSTITNCSFYNFKNILKGNMQYLTKIHDNTFFNMNGSCISNTSFDDNFGLMFDSEFTNNYINGSLEVNNTIAIDVKNLTFCKISNNWIEFFYKGVYAIKGKNLEINYNTIDYVYWGIFISKTCGSDIMNNKFGHISKIYKTSFKEPHSDMDNNWYCFVCGAEVGELNFMFNRGLEGQIDRMATFTAPGRRNIKTNGNYINGKYFNGDNIQEFIEWDGSITYGMVDNGKGNCIEEYQNLDYTTFPSLAQSFYGHTFFTSNKLVINKNGTFIGIVYS